jgi:hypothetical protein
MRPFYFLDFRALEKALPSGAHIKYDFLDSGIGIGVPDGPSATNKLLAWWSELRGEKSNSFLVSRPDHEMIPKFVQICMAALLIEVEKEAKSLRKSILCSRGVSGLEVVTGELLKGEALKVLVGLFVPA